jgi:hypothetical protein
MRWTDWVWLLLGIGIGVVASQVAQKSRKLLPTSRQAQTTVSENPSEKKQDLLEQLEQAQLAYTMAAEMAQSKGTFLARTSHELRSPLNSMIGVHQLILADLCDSPEEEREFIAQANTSALKMVQVLDDVIDVAKVEHGSSELELQPLHVGQLLQEIYSLTYLQAANRNLQLQIPDLEPDSPEPNSSVLADPNRLRQVLVSLIDTAIAEMSTGQITLLVEPSANPNSLCIAIEQTVPMATWKPSPDRDNSNPADSKQHQCLQPEGSALDKTDLAHLGIPPFPSPAFNFLVAQKLVRSMKGELEIQSLADQAISGPTRIACTMPLVPLA